MKPKDLKVGKKYFWFGDNQIDILQYIRYVYFEKRCAYQFIVIASTSKWEPSDQETGLDLTAIEFTFPYNNLWQFCNLFFDFRRKTKLYKLKVP